MYSLYLFRFVLMHLFEDVEQKYERTFGVMSGVLRLGSPLWDLEYADDTVLLSNSSHQVQKPLHLIQEEEHVVDYLSATRCQL